LDLFEYSKEKQLKKSAPLAERMRPSTLEEFVGQEEIIGRGKLLYRAIKADRLSSIIFYGPPGTGKTTLANIIANSTKSHFTRINAVISGKEEIKKIIKEAKERLGMYGQRIVLFIDEIHRFNKSQQDALLPYVEDGTLILIGSTTQNPYFEIISPLLSRSRIFELKPLTEDEIRSILVRALKDKDRGLGNHKIKMDENAIQHIIRNCNGDARVALNALELAFLTTPPDADGTIHIDISIAEESIQKKALTYDKNGDEHYDTISAFIKSMRGSDPDATLYWLAKMIYAGEDPMFIARRIIICASEDVGNADPNALNIAVSAAKAVELIGMPEGKIPLAHAAVYVACAPKSNSCYEGINRALKDIENNRVYPVPEHLKDACYYGAKKLGRGKDYKYPHNYENNYVEQDYLPKAITHKSYYNPTSNGYEKIIRKRLQELKK